MEIATMSYVTKRAQYVLDNYKIFKRGSEWIGVWLSEDGDPWCYVVQNTYSMMCRKARAEFGHFFWGG